MKKIFVAIALFIFSMNLLADEGMWIPLLLKEFNESAMQKLGCKLTAEDIYSVNHSSLKDAIVQFGGGCTGELVSGDGLVLTNHHCGFYNIQQLSTVEHNYLKNGFWAMNKSQELPAKGLICTFVVRIEDVTKKTLEGVTDKMTEDERNKTINDNSKKIETEAVNGTHYKAKVKPYFFGSEYYMTVTETYTDVRLVGTPPESIGKFGGETDNWMWPRHTCDFSMFRIYANTNNEPAEYSADNKPFKPKSFLSISMKGYKQGDFTMTYGFPGTTLEYLTSYGIKLVTEVSNPHNIKVRGLILDIWHADMKANEKVGIQYASKYARLSNYYKKFQGEDKGMRVIQTVKMKEELEKKFQDWADKGNNHQYKGLLAEYKTAYTKLSPLQIETDIYSECVMNMEIVRYANGFNTLYKLCKDEKSTDSSITATVEQMKKNIPGYFKDYNAPTDKKIMVAMLNHYYVTSQKDFRAATIDDLHNKYNGDFAKYADEVFKKSVFGDEKKITDFLNSFTRKKGKKLDKDPAFFLARGLVDNYITKISVDYNGLRSKINLLQRTWVAGLREMESDKKFWPDANSTLRIAYGTVQPYKPYDGAKYEFMTTLSGVIEKMDNTNDEFTVPQKLVDLYNNRDFGQYAENGDVPVAFIATNHTTGGNSGSPLLDAEGYLLGLNFDTVWEGTMSNYHFSEERVRNISVDIRYVLFMMDKFAGAGYLLDEMKLVK